MLNTDHFNIVASYFSNILDNVEILEQFSNSSDFDPCTLADVSSKLAAIRRDFETALQSIAAADQKFTRAVHNFLKNADMRELKQMESPDGYDWSFYKSDSWPELTARKLRLFQSYLQ